MTTTKIPQSLINWIVSIETKVQTINERTKSHTLQIRELTKEVKK